VSRWLDWIRAEHLPSARGGAPRLTKAEREERDELVVGAVREWCEAELLRRARLEHEGKGEVRYSWFSYHGASAASVAWHLGAAPAQRLGNGAVAGSWSGSMPTALRLAPVLRSLAKRGLLAVVDHDYRAYYTPLDMPWYRAREQGRELLRQAEVRSSGAVSEAEVHGGQAGA
jgi:hypothetical protein